MLQQCKHTPSAHIPKQEQTANGAAQRDQRRAAQPTLWSGRAQVAAVVAAAPALRHPPLAPASSPRPVCASMPCSSSGTRRTHAHKPRSRAARSLPTLLIAQLIAPTRTCYIKTNFFFTTIQASSKQGKDWRSPMVPGFLCLRVLRKDQVTKLQLLHRRCLSCLHSHLPVIQSGRSQMSPQLAGAQGDGRSLARYSKPWQSLGSAAAAP